MKYAYIEKDTNKLLGWYDDTIHNDIPTPNIEVTDDQWQNAINSNHNKINNDGSSEQFDFRSDDEKLEDEKNNKISDAKEYLNSTDWYYARQLETGENIPEEIKNKRSEYRKILKTLGL